MNNPILTPAAAGGGRLNLLQSNSIMTRAGGVLLLTLLPALFVLVLAQPAKAEQIKVSCGVYAKNHVDPIAHAHHLHQQIGNTSTTNDSTGDSLFSNPSTSCNFDWFTSAGWFPVEKGEEAIRGVQVYYRDGKDGEGQPIRDIPRDLELLGLDQKYNCGRGSTFTSSPQYNCTGTWATQVSFPDCINTTKLADEATNAVNSRRGVCPSTHPYRIPKITYLISHADDNIVTNPLMVSAGVDAWHDYTFMHGDYFSANQTVFNDELLDLCLRDASDRVLFADPRCGEPPK